MNNKQRVFVEEYLKCWNATEAAKRAGYSERTAYSHGARLLKDVEISDAIEERLKELHMSTDEALQLLAEQARGDLGEFMDISSVGFNLDLLDADGNKKNTRLIRKIKQRTTTFIAKKESDEDREVTETEIELYDAQSAIDKILKVAGKLNTNDSIVIEVNLKGDNGQDKS